MYVTVSTWRDLYKMHKLIVPEMCIAWKMVTAVKIIVEIYKTQMYIEIAKGEIVYISKNNYPMLSHTGSMTPGFSGNCRMSIY